MTTLIVLFVVLASFGVYIIWMPGISHRGTLPELTHDEQILSEKLATHVKKLAIEIGERNVNRISKLTEARNYIRTTWEEHALLVHEQEFSFGTARREKVSNLEVIFPSEGGAEVVVIGAHYDSALNCPGANDNGSGVAALLELAPRFKAKKFKRELRFVAFVNEEPPHFLTESMGSFVYARVLRDQAIDVSAMLSIETIGYYSDENGSQQYPFPFSLFYPDTGNFIGFVGNLKSGGLVRQTVAAFRKTTKFPAEGVAAPAFIPGVGWSDHASFWKHGYRALMVTDTAPFRYPDYHLESDTPDKLDYARLARVVDGLEHVIRDLVE